MPVERHQKKSKVLMLLFKVPLQSMYQTPLNEDSHHLNKAMDVTLTDLLTMVKIQGMMDMAMDMVVEVMMTEVTLHVVMMTEEEVMAMVQPMKEVHP
jgi:hypothetical protein